MPPSFTAANEVAAKTGSFPPVSELLPQGPPMRLVDSVVEERPDGVVSRVVIDPDFVFLRSGRADIVVCLELVAQTVGCYAGLADLRSGTARRPGLMVGCRDARFFDDALYVGDELQVSVQRLWIRESVASFRGEVTRAGRVIARVDVSVVSGDFVDHAAQHDDR